MKSIFTPQIGITGKAMDLRMERQNAVMSNLANLRTPRYQPVRIEFEKELQAALGLGEQGQVTRTSDKHMPVAFDLNSFDGKSLTEVKPRIVHGEDRVDLDKEMSVMAKNTLNYNALVTVLQKNFDMLKQTITDGSR